MPLTGAGIRIGDATEFGAGIRFPRGMASDGTTLLLFDANNGHTLNPTTGVALRIGSLTSFGVSESQLRAACWNGTNFVFYGNSRRRLYTYNSEDGSVTDLTGQLSIRGSTTNPDIWGLAFLDGEYWALDRNTDALYKINTTPDELVQVGSATNYGLTGSPNIQAFTAYKGELIAASNGLDQLVQFNRTTGVATVIADNALPDGSPEALVEHDGTLLMAGSAADALFRLYDVLWDETIPAIAVDEGGSTTKDLSTVSQDASSFEFAPGRTARSWVTLSGTEIRITNAPAVTEDTDFEEVVRAVRDGVHADKTLTVRVRDTTSPPPADAVLEITVNPNSVTAGGVATVTFTFDKPVGGFTDAVVNVSAGATKGTLTDEGNNVWTLPVTAPSSGNGTVTVSVGADVVTPGNNADSVQFAYTAPPPPPPRVRSVPRFTTAPLDVKVELTPTTALITWKAPTNGAALRAYEIGYAEGASPGTDWIPTGSLSTRFLVKRLKRGTQYTWQVRGVTESGPGTASRPVTERTPIASLHNALFFKECVNALNNGERVSEYGNPSNIIRAVADNNYKTSSTVKDYAINIAVNGQPTRVDAIFVKGIDIEGHSAAPTGGTGSGYSNRKMPDTVENWEGTAVSTIVAGFQHDLYLLDQHFTATSVRMTFTGANAKIYEIMLLEFGLEIDANADFAEIATNFVDREGVIHPDPGGGIVHDSPIGSERDKWQVDYVVKIVPGKTLLETPEEFLYWRSENRNHVHAMEPSRFPWRVFPGVFVRKSVPVRYRTDDKLGGEILNFRVAEQ